MAKIPKFKICVFGESGVGKSTLISKCFKEADYESLGMTPKLTVGITLYNGIINLDGMDIKLQIWELTGKEKFKNLKIPKTKREGKADPRAFYESFVLGAAGAIFVYDITDKSSVEDLNNWLGFYRSNEGTLNTPVLMIGNKLDLQEKRTIKNKNANKLAFSNDLIGAIEVSALESDKVKQLFTNFTRIIINKRIVKTFKSNIDLRILILLRIFKELDLKKMAYHLGKSKSTLSRHTKDLIKADILESYSKEDEIQPGNIKRKYYRLNNNFSLLLEKQGFDLDNAIEENNWERLLTKLPKYSYEYKKIKLISDHLNSYIEAAEKHLLTSVAMEDLPMIDTLNVLIEGLEYNLLNYRFISEIQYEKVKALSLEFHSKLDEILKDDDSSEKPYLYLDFFLNLLAITKYGNKTGLYLLGLRQMVKETQSKINKNK
ncbi:MAG: ArsR family transcriptional regulator [Candidatus Hodarchaeota archaeon]